MAVRTIDTPSFVEWPAEVKHRTFAVFSVDPVASVSALRDPEATHQASELPRGKYLGIIDSIRNDASFWEVAPLRPPTAISLMVIGRGLPPEPDIASCTPLADPNAHPTGRSHITPEHALPWQDCYVYSGKYVSARVDRIHICEPEKMNHISPEQQDQLLSNELEDAQRGLSSGPPSISDAASVRHPPEEEDEPDPPAPEEHGNTSSSRSSSSQPDQDPEVSAVLANEARVEDEAISESSHSSQSTAVVGREPRRERTRIEVWLDVSIAIDIGSPGDLDAVLDKLREIEEKTLERIEQTAASGLDNAATQQWAQNVAEAVIEPPVDTGAIAEAGTGDDTAVDKPPGVESKSPSRSPLSNVAAKAQRLASDLVEMARRVWARLAALSPFRRRGATAPAAPATPAALADDVATPEP